jgi:hypothetical protein
MAKAAKAAMKRMTSAKAWRSQCVKGGGGISENHSWRG